jgi:hypothetical protein
VTNSGPSARPPTASSIARAVRGERDGDHLAALADDDQGTVAALEAELLDVGAGRF